MYSPQLCERTVQYKYTYSGTRVDISCVYNQNEFNFDPDPIHGLTFFFKALQNAYLTIKKH